MKPIKSIISLSVVLCFINVGLSKNVEAQENSSWMTDYKVILGGSSFFEPPEDEIGMIDTDSIYQDSHCANSLEVPLWDNPSLSGAPKRYTASAPYNPTQESTFLADIGDHDDKEVEERVGKWWTSSMLNGTKVLEKPYDAYDHRVKSWPIRAVVLATPDVAGTITLNTIHFTPTGQAIQDGKKKLKKHVSLTCGQLFLLDGKQVQSSVLTGNPALSYLPSERRLCNFYPNLWPEFMFTEGGLEEHRKNLLTYCKRDFFEDRDSASSQLPTSIKDVPPPRLQSFIPTELDLTKPIDEIDFILTIRFEDPVQPVYHKDLPKVCLADCPKSGAKQIQGIELKREGD